MTNEARRTGVTLRAAGAMGWLAMAASLAACSGGGSKSGPGASLDPSDYTVSYRSQVRVPGDGAVMKEQAFADQVSRLDPIEAKRCPVSNDAAFQTAADALGGITWTHPVAILKDQSLPPLYKGKRPAAASAARADGRRRGGRRTPPGRRAHDRAPGSRRLPGQHGDLPVAAARSARREDRRPDARAELRAQAAGAAEVLLLPGQRARAARQRPVGQRGGAAALPRDARRASTSSTRSCWTSRASRTRACSTARSSSTRTC